MKILFGLTFILLLSGACQKKSEEKNMTGKVMSQSDCKDFKSTNNTTDVADTLSCVTYKFYPSENKLLLTHQNSGFNCCPGELTCKISNDSDTIVIQEFEESNTCDCSCLFDINIEISGIESKAYFLKFIEPYCGDQENLIFGIDLASQTEGINCAVRDKYPWGIFR